MINLMGKSLDMGFTLTGEGFILISQVAYGISTILINIYSKKVSPVVLSGTQFTMGGIVLTLIGVGMGGHLGNVTAVGVVSIFYLAMVSAVAYTLWSVLLAWNDVSKVAIFGFVNPLCSVILSALILGVWQPCFWCVRGFILSIAEERIKRNNFLKKSRKIKPKSHFVHLYNVDYTETFYTTVKTGHASGRSRVCLFKKRAKIQ